MIEEWKKA